MWHNLQPKWIIIFETQPNYRQANEQCSTSQSRTVSLSLVPHLATEQRLDVSFKPIVSTSKSRKYLKDVSITQLDYNSFKAKCFEKWQCDSVIKTPEKQTEEKKNNYKRSPKGGYVASVQHEWDGYSWQVEVLVCKTKYWRKEGIIEMTKTNMNQSHHMIGLMQEKDKPGQVCSRIYKYSIRNKKQTIKI